MRSISYTNKLGKVSYLEAADWVVETLGTLAGHPERLNPMSDGLAELASITRNSELCATDRYFEQQGEKGDAFRWT